MENATNGMQTARLNLPNADISELRRMFPDKKSSLPGRLAGLPLFARMPRAPALSPCPRLSTHRRIARFAFGFVRATIWPRPVAAAARSWRGCNIQKDIARDSRRWRAHGSQSHNPDAR